MVDQATSKKDMSAVFAKKPSFKAPKRKESFLSKKIKDAGSKVKNTGNKVAREIGEAAKNAGARVARKAGEVIAKVRPQREAPTIEYRSNRVADADFTHSAITVKYGSLKDKLAELNISIPSQTDGSFDSSKVVQALDKTNKVKMSAPQIQELVIYLNEASKAKTRHQQSAWLVEANRLAQGAVNKVREELDKQRQQQEDVNRWVSQPKDPTVEDILTKWGADQGNQTRQSVTPENKPSLQGSTFSSSDYQMIKEASKRSNDRSKPSSTPENQVKVFGQAGKDPTVRDRNIKQFNKERRKRETGSLLMQKFLELQDQADTTEKSA